MALSTEQVLSLCCEPYSWPDTAGLIKKRKYILPEVLILSYLVFSASDNHLYVLEAGRALPTERQNQVVASKSLSSHPGPPESADSLCCGSDPCIPTFGTAACSTMFFTGSGAVFSIETTTTSTSDRPGGHSLAKCKRIRKPFLS